MADEQEVKTQEVKSNWLPTNGTAFTTLGGAIGFLFIVIMHSVFNIDFPAGQEVLFGSALATIFSYLHPDGRK